MKANSVAAISLLVLTVGHLRVSCHSSSATQKAYSHEQRFFEPDLCSNLNGFSKNLNDEIKAYAPIVKKIADFVLESRRGIAYDELALFTDTIGPRLSGSASLARGIEYMLNKFNSSMLDNVHGEPAMIPRWERGNEWAKLVEPVEKKMEILALGTSVGTNKQTIQAPVVQIKSWSELDQRGKAGELKDKIVLFNVKFTTYGQTVQYRSAGARRAGPYGAKAALVRSVTPFSIYSPHTGATSYDESDTNAIKIPTAAVTLEDADLIERWINRNKTVVLQIYMEAQNFPNVESMNVVGDITGYEKPDNFVVVSGHIDSWDVTSGALDDGGGMMISFLAVDVLRRLKLRARRTVRAILWTSEEFGYWGARQYFENCKKDGTLSKYQAVFESDLGTFTPVGLAISPNAQALTKCIVNQVVQLFAPYNMSKFDTNFEGSDIDLFADVGVPSISLSNKNEHYFFFHHTRGDSMTVENPDDLDKAVIIWAASSYILADLTEDLPRKLTI